MAKVLWTRKGAIGPKPRAGHAVTYDAVRNRIVLFGGDSLAGSLFGDTWEWNGESWAQVQDIGPSARAFHALAYDSSRGRSVLFGGRTASARLGDTWEWDGESWAQAADSGPVARSGHSMTFDSVRQRIVLFGGELQELLNDIWEWDGSRWVQQDEQGPSARINAAMAYDSSRNRIVLFGGASQNQGLGDTWERSGVTWAQAADFGPDACAGAAMVFKGTRIALFGGISSLTTLPELFGRSWEWDGKQWTARQDIGPGPLVFHAMAFDSARQRIVLFGGLPVPPSVATATDVRGDTWEQFEAGQSAVPVEIAAVDAAPNPVQAGSSSRITVTLAAPAPTTADVDLLRDLQLFATIQIPPQATSGTFELSIPASQPTTTVTLTARSGRSLASTTLTIQSPVTVTVVSLAVVPNPAARGQIVTVTVEIASPAPEDVGVLLFANEQLAGSIDIPTGATSGARNVPIPLVSQTGAVNLSARSGSSRAETVLQVT